MSNINYNALAIPKGKTVKQCRAKAKRDDAKNLRAFQDGVWEREHQKCPDASVGAYARCQDCSSWVWREASAGEWLRGHVHHVVSRRHKRTRYDVANGRLLCRGCHVKVHGREF